MPIQRNGQNIGDITLNGNAIGEVTVNGQTVFSASAIPDSSLLQSPIYRFLYEGIGVSDGTQNFSIPDDLNNIPDATVASGTVTYREAFDGVSAGDYPSGAFHSYNPGSNQPVGNESYTVMALIYIPDTTGDTHLFGWGNPDGGNTDTWGLVVRDAGLIHFTGDISNQRGGSVPQNAWFTVMTHWDNGPNNLTGYLNGSQVIQDPGIRDRTHTDSDYRIGFAFRSAKGQKFVADLLVSDVVESDSVYQDYHNGWFDFLNN